MLTTEEWIAVVLVAIIAAVFELRPILLPNGEDLTFISPLLLIVGIQYGFFPILVTILFFCIVIVSRNFQAWKPISFNGIQYALSAIVALHTYVFVGGKIGSIDLSHVLSYSLFIIIYHFTNLFLVNIYIYTRERVTISLDIRSIGVYFTLMTFAILITKIIEVEGAVGIILFSVVLMGLSIVYRTYYKMYDDFKTLSIKDGLTGLYNHRFFQQKLEEVIVEQQDVALLLLDIDYFKIYNDKFGHPKGDILLKDVSDLLLRMTPADGFACRYGGEEFSIILPTCKTEDALILAEKIRESISTESFHGVEELPNQKVTVSIGVSAFPYLAQTKENLIKGADTALYHVKNTVKNRVELFNPYENEGIS
ncbi:GGDEF domain-containing protein [Bacillus pinisoli]|uniref:GGDEF domain-containing protein n=1 Tax=Bacillus pinisoli TaxID=2901866 RepID=UPI001FF4B604|nr:GGDEF domain-containing protein [Bacillus pinisoli]